MFDLSLYLTTKQNAVNGVLDDILAESNNTSKIESAMRYSLLAGGKRLRPILCMAAAESVGEDGERFIHEACAIEMIHTYSLIHDDLPAIDNDDLRRGKPTSHKAYNEATAILAGDALLTLAFQVLSSKFHLFSEKKAYEKSIKWIEVINIISRAAGYKGMIEGQMIDIASEGTRIALDELENMHYLKTGALIEASIKSGAIMGGGSHKQTHMLCIYAKHIGLAFQVIDDILNVEGDPLIMGKAVGTDGNLNKSTYPSLIGLEKSKKMAESLVQKAINSIKLFDERSDPLRAIAEYIIKRKK